MRSGRCMASAVPPQSGDCRADSLAALYSRTERAPRMRAHLRSSCSTRSARSSVTRKDVDRRARRRRGRAIWRALPPRRYLRGIRLHPDPDDAARHGRLVRRRQDGRRSAGGEKPGRGVLSAVARALRPATALTTLPERDLPRTAARRSSSTAVLGNAPFFDDLEGRICARSSWSISLRPASR